MPSSDRPRGDVTSRRAAGPPGVEEMAQISLTFDDNKLASLVLGQYDQNLAHLERRLGVLANANGNHVVISEESVEEWEYYLGDEPVPEDRWYDKLSDRRDVLKSVCMN